MKSVAWKGDHPITSYYGWRTDPITGIRSFHDGVDVSMPIGTELYATVNGKVRLATTDSYGGKYIQIQTSDGRGHWCLHLSEFKVKAGDMIQKGNLIGLSGNSGHSTGPHTHFGLQSNATVWSSHIDPLPSLQAQPTERFKRGDSIVFTDIQNIRKGSGTSYDITGQSVIGSTYEIEDGPRFADGYAWYDLKNNNWVADVGKFRIATPEEINPTPTPEPPVPIPTPTPEPTNWEERYNQELEKNKGLVEDVRALEKEVKRLELEIEQKEVEYRELREECDSLEEKNKMLEEERLLLQEKQDGELKDYRRWSWLVNVLNSVFPRK